jgi:hypothetical protein
MERLTENSVASLGAGETPAHPGTCASSNRSSVPGTFQNDEWRSGENAPIDQDLILLVRLLAVLF